eukprot:GEMP01009553.1.p1 GENE.GEMP01009553.1~~GEMP01009553.1.p1  ORF type:complete len:975 (-),score=208.20 GEMP01009553.1:420-3344(-)
MDESNYDEFGNYIGPELDASDNENESEDEWLQQLKEDEPEGEEEQADGETLEVDRSIVLQEDKKYYPDASEVYPGAETLVQEEDTQPITDPIVAPIKTFNFDFLEKSMPQTTFEYDFLSGFMEKERFIRNVTLLGPLHSGKTGFMDLLVQNTHDMDWKWDRDFRYTDSRTDEQDRAISVKATPMSFVLQDSKDKSYLINVYDTPGHTNFQDEVTAAMRVSDGVVIMVDAIQGLNVITQRMMMHAIQEKMAIIFAINGIDRLVSELKLPPSDAYHKLRHTIEAANEYLEDMCATLGCEPIVLSPLKGNVLFTSGVFGFCFTLRSFAEYYLQESKTPFDVEEFTRCLWGNVYFDVEEYKFSRTQEFDAPRSFVHFILDPMYKLISHVLGEERESLQKVLAQVGITLTRKEYDLDTKSLLKVVGRSFFGGVHAFVDSLLEHVPSPGENAKRKTEHIYSGNQAGVVARSMKKLDKNGPLMVHTVKNYHRPDMSCFDCFGRVMSGTLYKGDFVKILGENYSLDDDEDSCVKEVQKLWIYQGRYRVEVSHVPAGNWVLIGGVDQSINKTATITNAKMQHEVEVFRPLKFATCSVMKVACEPLNPSELPKMVEGLRKIGRSYPLCTTKVEESGEHVVLGTGELYMDSVLHDLRKLYGDLEIKVADPVVSFCETVVETSSLKCYAETPNKKNKLYMICDTLEKGVAEDLESGAVNPEWSTRQMGDFFVNKYQWDVLAARSIWAFGPEPTTGSNVLVDDSLPTEVDKALLGQCRDSITQGFQWACREGPLCDEPIRNVKFKILDAQLASDPTFRGGGQMIPTARRCAYSAFLLATPRLLEPMIFAEIECPADCVPAIYQVLSRRRGHVASDKPKPGSPQYTVHAYLPVIDSFGFETDLRTHTSGQSMCQCLFDYWSQVPGDPLDKSILLRPLEPSDAPHLARDFLLKTRRRKGLSEDVSVHKYFDESLLLEMANTEGELNTYF